MYLHTDIGVGGLSGQRVLFCHVCGYSGVVHLANRVPANNGPVLQLWQEGGPGLTLEEGRKERGAARARPGAKLDIWSPSNTE